MIKKNSEANDATFNTDHSMGKGKRSNSKETNNSKHSSSVSSRSSRSKYLSGHKITKASLFDSIRGRKAYLIDCHE
jgi:hypothetical protein